MKNIAIMVVLIDLICSKGLCADTASPVEVARIIDQEASDTRPVMLSEERMRATLVPAFLLKDIMSHLDKTESIEGVSYFFMNGLIGEISQGLTSTRYFDSEVYRSKWTKIGAKTGEELLKKKKNKESLLNLIGFNFVNSKGFCRISGPILIFTPENSSKSWFLFPTKERYGEIKRSLEENGFSPLSVKIEGWLSLKSVYSFPVSSELCSRVLIVK